MTVWNGIGMNYGHQASYDSAQVASDLSFLYGAGLRLIRIAYPPYNTDATTLSNLQAMVTSALAQGFYVLWGVTTSGTVTATIWTAFKSYVTGTLAPWAQTNRLSELALGNEEEARADGTTITSATMQSDLRTVAGTVKSGGFTGKVSYQTYTAQVANWASGGLGSNLDYLGVNQYDILSNFTANVQTQRSAFGSKTSVSEFGCINLGYGDYNNEDAWMTDVVNRIAVLQSQGIPSGYFFCYRDGGFGLGANTFGVVKTDNSVRKARSAVLSAASAPTAFHKF